MSISLTPAELGLVLSDPTSHIYKMLQTEQTRRCVGHFHQMEPIPFLFLHLILNEQKHFDQEKQRFGTPKVSFLQVLKNCKIDFLGSLSGCVKF